MNLKTAQIMEQSAEELGIDLIVSESYSGRGMYGRRTVGVSVNNIADLIPIAAYAGKIINDKEELLSFVEDVGSLRTDSMGKGIIVY